MNILITGGASGLGGAMTKRLAKNESNTVWFSYRSAVGGAKMLQDTFSNAHGISCDFTNTGDVAGLLKKMNELDLDVLVNNAIASPIVKKHFHKTTAETFQRGFAQNILPTIEVTQNAIGRFRAKNGGRIITVLTATLVGKPPVGYSEYTAAKAYIHSLAKSWAIENAAYGITSNCVSPSYMATQLTEDTDARIVEEMVSRHPLKRLLTTDEVAQAVEFLISAPAQINGANIVINAASEIL